MSRKLDGGWAAGVVLIVFGVVAIATGTNGITREV